jgi:hypothetical protein
MLEWRVEFLHEKLDGLFASITWDLNGKCATFVFNLELDKKDHEQLNIEKTAFHEVVHLLIGPLYTLARRRFVEEDRIEEISEDIVRTLENTIFQKLKE